MMNWNNDIRSPELIDWCEELGLKNAILDMHPNIADVPTYHRGSNPIDGIFVICR